jgi:hypothetical protein
MFIATALSPRGDIILSSSPQEAAHLIAKLQAGICRFNSRSAAKNKNNRRQKN